MIEGTWLSTRMNERRVVGVSDCLWGVLDGVNESGVAVSLAFGGKRTVGAGFGIPLVMRYVLEFASTTQEAVDTLGQAMIPTGPVLSPQQALEHPHTQHREMVVKMGDYEGLGSPIKLSRTPASYRFAPLSEGQEFLSDSDGENGGDSGTG